MLQIHDNGKGFDPKQPFPGHLVLRSLDKRMAKVKDSGGIFPGHGGILDRADATMFAAPVAYLFKMYLF